MTPTRDVRTDMGREDVQMGAEVVVERFDSRQWPEAQLDALFAEGFPQFILADQDAKAAGRT